MTDTDKPLATGSLLDPANVGKYVWFVFNGNTKFASLVQIGKITRTNVHTGGDGRNLTSMRVLPHHGAATGNKNGYMVSCHTQEWAEEREIRNGLIDTIRRLNLSDYSVAQLQAIIDITERNHTS